MSDQPQEQLPPAEAEALLKKLMESGDRAALIRAIARFVWEQDRKAQLLKGRRELR